MFRPLLAVSLLAVTHLAAVAPLPGRIAQAAAAKGDALRAGIEFAQNQAGASQIAAPTDRGNINDVYIDREAGAVVKKEGAMGLNRAREEERLIDDLFAFYMPNSGVVPQADVKEMALERWGIDPFVTQDERLRAIEITADIPPEVLQFIVDDRLTPKARNRFHTHRIAGGIVDSGFLVPIPFSTANHYAAFTQAKDLQWSVKMANGNWQAVSFDTAYRRALVRPSEVRAAGTAEDQLIAALFDPVHQTYQQLQEKAWEVSVDGGIHWRIVPLSKLHVLLLLNPDLIHDSMIRHPDGSPLTARDGRSLALLESLQWDFIPSRVINAGGVLGNVCAKPFIEDMALASDLTDEEMEVRVNKLTSRAQVKSILALMVQLADLHRGNIGFTQVASGSYDLIFFDTDISMLESNKFNLYSPYEGGRISPIRSCLFGTSYTARPLTPRTLRELKSALAYHPHALRYLWREDAAPYQALDRKERQTLRGVLKETLRPFSFGNYKFREIGVKHLRAQYADSLAFDEKNPIWNYLTHLDISTWDKRRNIAYQLFPRVTLAQLEAFTERADQLTSYLAMTERLGELDPRANRKNVQEINKILNATYLPLPADRRHQLREQLKNDPKKAYDDLVAAVAPTYFNCARAMYPSVAELDRGFFQLRDDPMIQYILSIDKDTEEAIVRRRIRALIGNPNGDIDMLVQLYDRNPEHNLTPAQKRVKASFIKGLKA